MLTIDIMIPKMQIASYFKIFLTPERNLRVVNMN